MPLANDSYRNVPTLTDGTDLLNLAWTLDEGTCLDVDLQQALADQLRHEVTGGLPSVNSYLVRDPYGEELLGPAVAALFPGTGEESDLVTGAGVISLLHCLVRLAGDRPVYVIGDVYPDLPHWADVAGVGCVSRHDVGGGPDHAANAVAVGAGLVLLERPALTGEQVDLATVEALCAATAGQGTVVLVDESYANYHPPGYSALPLTSRLSNLVVVRGLAKAYGMGGLRLGFAVSSRALRARIRAAVPPMLASSLSLRLGRAVLALGDITAGLRSRVETARRETLAALAGAGLEAPLSASRYVPFLFYPADDHPAAVALRDRGIVGKRHVHWSERSRATADRYRLSVPLRPDRLLLLRTRLAAGPAPAAR
ncbi:aminotransferase class I/II-fold pyridoxal phosphate-dependent enzyme [Micromonospora cathayae]|uniref:Aminotransferase n=1 Tax=Micromonospora cathayae TaxID=3028804 RepID=A0ABY7ZS41_9ACTN|nr:aminotransferase class I/II-fold pyridoxal phosphate-dependent enzyme [Micromonospora sp. HUAS 3]WDZ85850.1 aminotransferase class I/II-fold pyridoxal phosphate-dependent enzyme [Micromonospora sp. HUAS 3]